MKVAIPAEVLREISKLVSATAPTSPSREILKGALIDVANGVLTVVATDLKTTMVATFPVEGEPGAAVVDAGLLSSIAAVASGRVSLEREPGADFLMFRSSGRRGRAPCMSRSAWPTPPRLREADASEGFLVNASIFLDRLQGVEWAQGETDRQFLHGVCMWGDGSKVWMRACSGYCIATTSIAAECAPFDPQLVPRPTIERWLKVLGRASGNILVAASDTPRLKIDLPVGDDEIAVTVSGVPHNIEFPSVSVEQMTSLPRDPFCEVERAAFLRLIRDARKVVANQKDKTLGVTSTSVKLTPGSGVLGLESRDNTGGLFTGEVAAKIIEARPKGMEQFDGVTAGQSGFYERAISTMGGSHIRLLVATDGKIFVEGFSEHGVYEHASTMIVPTRVPW